MGNPLVSVIISCYNHEKFIEEAIDSVMNQTYQNFELLLTDDGSTDNSRDVIERTIKKYNNDPRISYTPNEKNTSFKCIEELYPKIRGKYYSGLGSDDMWEPEKLQKQVEFLEKNPEYKACFTWIQVMQDDPELAKKGEEYFNVGNQSQAEWIRTFWTIGNRLNAPSLMMVTDIWRELSGYDYDYRQLQDFDLWVRFLQKYQLYIVPERLTIYRRHENNLSDPQNKGVIGTNIAELENIWFEFMRYVPDELFMQSFYPEVKIEKGSELYHTEISCRKFMLLVNTKTEYGKQLAIRYWFTHRHDEAFLKVLKERFGFTRQDMFRFRADSSVYSQLNDQMTKNKYFVQMLNAGRLHLETFTLSDEEMVGELLDLIDAEKTDDAKTWGEFTDDYLSALLRVCRKLPDGKNKFKKIIDALY